MYMEIDLEAVLTPEIKDQLDKLNLRAVGVALMVEPVETANGGASTTSPATYKVVPGDMLSAIAARFNTTVAKLVELNDIENPNLIQVGQILKLR